MVDIIAHRGLSARYKSNTVDAFKAALEAGFKRIEMDVRHFKGNVIISHGKPRFFSRIIKLENVIRKLGRNVVYHIEFKDVESVDKVCEIANRFGINVVFSSFNLEALERVKMNGNYVIEALSKKIPTQVIEKKLFKMNCRKLNLSKKVSWDKLKDLTKKYDIGIYTVNNSNHARNYAQAGASRIFTDTDKVLYSLV